MKSAFRDESESFANDVQAHLLPKQQELQRVEAILQSSIVHRLSTVRLVSDGVKVDLLFASSGIEHEVVADATDVEVLESDPAGTFDEPAVDAVRKWIYAPRKENGVAVASTAKAKLVFDAAN